MYRYFFIKHEDKLIVLHDKETGLIELPELQLSVCPATVHNIESFIEIDKEEYFVLRQLYDCYSVGVYNFCNPIQKERLCISIT